MKSRIVSKIYISKTWIKILISPALCYSGLAFSEPEPPKSFTAKPPVQPKDSLHRTIPEDFNNCGTNAYARKLAELISKDEEQLRPIINCDKKLAAIANSKAKEMAELMDVSHEGRYQGPNQRLMKFGYPLNEIDKIQHNSVEAILGGEEYPDETWITFQMSYGHKVHLLAEHDYFVNQSQLGVGYHKNLNSPHIHYWVVYFVAKVE